MENETLYVSEIFESAQGETSKAGLMTSFVRLSGCPFRCVWCDSAYTYERGEPWTIDNICAELTRMGWIHVCVTGGEPLAQDPIFSFLKTLVAKGFQVSLETSGGIPTKGVHEKVKIILDIKCPGSGVSDKNDWSNIDNLRTTDEIKFVVLDRADYEWTKQTIKKYSLFSKVDNVLISTVWDRLSPDELIAWMVKDKLPARLNLQIHKYIWDPEMRGI